MQKLVFAALMALSIASPCGAGDFTINRLLAFHCAQCHGTDGYAVGDMDKLAGESAKDLREELRDMRREDAPENIMDHQALGYTEAQIALIASYYATLPDDRGDVHQDDFEDPEDEEEDDDEEDEEDEEDEDDEDNDDDH